MENGHDSEQPEVGPDAGLASGDVDDAELDEASSAGLWPPPPIYPS